VIRPVFLLIALGCLGVATLLVVRHIHTSDGQPPLPMIRVVLGERSILAELAASPRQQEAGLSGRSGLADGNGMLFVFEPPKNVGFWMKGMRFPLDIIYADDDGIVMNIHSDVSPATYPRAFHSVAPAKYALEVPAGFATVYHIGIGARMVVLNRP
jgi:uncharacterized membrane protein (UPF0127 family)